MDQSLARVEFECADYAYSHLSITWRIEYLIECAKKRCVTEKGQTSRFCDFHTFFEGRDSQARGSSASEPGVGQRGALDAKTLQSLGSEAPLVCRVCESDTLPEIQDLEILETARLHSVRVREHTTIHFRDGLGCTPPKTICNSESGSPPDQMVSQSLNR